MKRALDERAVSTTLSYALNLSVTTILITGLLIAGNGLVADQRERTIDAELRVLGQQLAGDISTTDRLVRSLRDDGTIESTTVEREYPRTVAGSRYRITLTSDHELELTSSDPEVTVTVSFPSETNVETEGSSVTGGPLVFEFVDSNSDGRRELVVGSNSG